MFHRFTTSFTAKRFVLIIASILFAISGLALPGLSGVHPAYANNGIVVWNTNDTGSGSLRQAISLALGYTGATTISFSVNGTITLGSSLVINSTSSNPITIDATGYSVVIDGNYSVVPFNIQLGAVVTLNGLTITHGNTSTIGGGVLNGGTLTITNSVLSYNSAAFDGGGIGNSYLLTLSGDFLNGNSTGTGGSGGAILNEYGGVLTMNSCVLYNNTAGNGAAINDYRATTTINDSTFHNNHATR